MLRDAQTATALGKLGFPSLIIGPLLGLPFLGAPTGQLLSGPRHGRGESPHRDPPLAARLPGFHHLAAAFRKMLTRGACTQLEEIPHKPGTEGTMSHEHGAKKKEPKFAGQEKGILRR